MNGGDDTQMEAAENLIADAISAAEDILDPMDDLVERSTIPGIHQQFSPDKREWNAQNRSA